MQSEFPMAKNYTASYVAMIRAIFNRGQCKGQDGARPVDPLPKYDETRKPMPLRGSVKVEKITKKERLFLDREREKLQNVLAGVVEMSRLPGLVYVVDVKKEAIAVKEAHKLGVPVVAIVDTNCDPEVIEYPIPANDDALKAVQLITKAIADAVAEGGQRVAARQAEEAMAQAGERKEESEKKEATEKA
jgi:ribosomal protein S2